MKHYKKISKHARGETLLEFAVVVALMAILAVSATPMFSKLLYKGHKSKTMSEIDKMIAIGNTFYQEKAESEGRGSLPGQQNNFTTPVGDYTSEAVVMADLEVFDSYEYENASKWRSLFGLNNADAGIPYEIQQASGVQEVAQGIAEWNALFNEHALRSPFQDGHYIYTVIPGSGSGKNAVAPVLFIADLENPSTFHKRFQP